MLPTTFIGAASVIAACAACSVLSAAWAEGGSPEEIERALAWADARPLGGALPFSSSGRARAELGHGCRRSSAAGGWLGLCEFRGRVGLAGRGAAAGAVAPLWLRCDSC